MSVIGAKVGLMGGQNFPVQAVVFDGSNDYMLRGADLTGNADGKVGTVSFWINFKGANATQQWILNDSMQRVGIGKNSSNKIVVQGDNTSGSRILGLDSGTAYTTASGWIHILASWDLASNIAHLYINDVVDDDGSTTATNSTIDYTNTNHSVGADNGGTNKTFADISEFYFNNETYVDISQVANRRKFISASGKPVDLGDNGELPTAATPRVYLSSRPDDAASAFATNKGDGGNFSINGAITIASTSPSD